MNTINTLRYRLMPYIYSLASKVTNEGYTQLAARLSTALTHSDAEGRAS